MTAVSTPPPARLRIATLLPAPAALAAYEPFRPLGGIFGITEIDDVSAASYAALQRVFRTCFAGGATLGYAPVPRSEAVFFDMDATVIAEESLVELARAVGKTEAVAEITESAMAGELDFKEALRERVALLKGIPAATVAEVAERLTLSRGIQPLVAFCREIGVPSYLVSGGFTVLAGAVQRKVGFAGVRTNVLGISQGKLTGTIDGEIVDAAVKRRFLLETCAKIGIDPRRAAAVGDGANDIPMLQEVGVAVGFKPKPVLLPYLHAVNAVGNHAFLGPLLFGRDINILRGPGRRPIR